MENRSKYLPNKGDKCARCRNEASICLPAHRANFCPECFVHYFENAVERGIKKMRLNRQDPLMIAVSGGKDSLATWQALHDLGLDTKGLFINLQIDEFSQKSGEAVQKFAEDRGLDWSQYDLKTEIGYTIPELHQKRQKKFCSLCGRIKRQLINRLAARENFQTVATGHNLDDEASRLLGNLIDDRQDFVEKQYPFLPSPHPRIPAKFKPLYRLEKKEILYYCELKNIQYVNQKCPFSKGATSKYFNQTLEFLEDKMPGTKRNFLYSYLKKEKKLVYEEPFNTCRECGEPSYMDICGICRLKNSLSRDDIKKL